MATPKSSPPARRERPNLATEVRLLGEAQRRTEEQIAQLVRTQQETSQQVAGLTQQVASLTQQVSGLAQQMTGLTQQVSGLTAAQQRTDERIDELVRVQKETSNQIADLAKAQTKLTHEVGALGNNVGLWAEDVARVVLPGYLERHLGVKLRGQLGEELGRRFVAGPTGEIELDLYGEGEQNGQPVEVLAEVKNRLYRYDVKRFAQQLQILAPQRLHKAIKVMFGFWIHPSAQEVAREEDILIVASYQR